MCACECVVACVYVSAWSGWVFTCRAWCACALTAFIPPQQRVSHRQGVSTGWGGKLILLLFVDAAFATRLLRGALIGLRVWRALTPTTRTRRTYTTSSLRPVMNQITLTMKNNTILCCIRLCSNQSCAQVHEVLKDSHSVTVYI